MDNRPIGFFDSGLGGLTSIPHLKRLLPKEKIIYFGDTARTPYGSKAVSTIRTFATQIADFLVSKDVKMIVIACNTVSSTCLEMLREKFPDVSIVGIIDPAAKADSKKCSLSSKIGIIGTKVTVRSGAYSKLIKAYDENFNIFETACPTFVPLIEEGIVASDIMDLMIRYYMEDFILEDRLDTIVLGCTHYPLIRPNIERLYPNLKIIDPSEEVVHRIAEIIAKNDMFAEDTEVENVFYASDLSENFLNMINRIFEETDITVKFKNLELEAV